MTVPRFKPVGDGALLVEFGDKIDDALNQTVIALDRALADADIAGVQEVVPALVNLLIVFDPVETDHTTIRSAVEALLPLTERQSGEVKQHDVPVCFDPDLTPDLVAVAKKCGMSVDDLVDTLTQSVLKVAMYGFAPGYAYLSGVPESIQVPRKQTPKPNVPKGSILIAGPQSIITPLTMPTGWSIIGRSPFAVMQNGTDTEFRFNVGDRVQYRPVGREALPSELQAP